MRRAFGVVFDIDGVLLRGKEVIPGARAAVASLRRAGVPVAVLTNGGGVLERDKAAQLSELLGAEIAPEECMLSHSPLRGGQLERALRGPSAAGAAPGGKNSHGRKKKKKNMKNLLHHEARQTATVLALGSLDYIQVAGDVLSDGVGIVTVADVMREFPDIYPFAAAAPESPVPAARRGDPRGPFHAAVVFHDPVDWAPDLQVLIDCLQLERGVGTLGDRSGAHKELVPIEDRVKFFHTQDDFVYQGTYPFPRFAQGSFVECAKHLHQGLLGEELRVAGVYGKPEASSYETAAKALQKKSEAPLEHFYMVGDNPRSDIAGICRLQRDGKPWTSFLVRTGVFQSAADNDADDPASHVVPDVGAAITAILKAEHVS
jgi:ribonucleotide monophosphatase NagD (HAD superfamily)